MTDGKAILALVKNSWAGWSDFRRSRRRNLDYAYGRQWNDMVNLKGETITEYEYILRQGNYPLKNNLIRRIVRNVTGILRSRLSESMKLWDERLLQIADDNSLYEFYSRLMEEFLISGFAVTRKTIECREGVGRVTTRRVAQGSFFCNPDFHDPRGWDLELVGEFHEVGYREWCAEFVRNERDLNRAREIFGEGEGKKLVIEVWRREVRSRRLLHDLSKGLLYKLDDGERRRVRGDMRERKVLEDVWHYYFLDEAGNVLREGDSPYLHGSHPYVMKFYPYIDGEIQSFVGDMIDQQRYTNRLITLYDWLLRASAKGVLLIPEGAVDAADIEEVAENWSRFNGVITYKAKTGQPEPKQVTGDFSNLGIEGLLNIQMKLLEDVSGVNGVLQGNLTQRSTSGSLFNQQTENAITSLSDLLDSFMDFIGDCCRKDLELQMQMEGTDALPAIIMTRREPENKTPEEEGKEEESK